MDSSAPTLGHNNPPEPIDQYPALKQRTDELVATANRWIAERPEITDADTAEKCQTFLEQLRAEFKAVEEQRKAEKQPHMDAAAAVDGRYNPLKALLETAAGFLKPKREAYLRKVEDAQREAARKAAAEAARIQREAEEAARKAQAGTGAVVGATVEAEQKRREAEEATARAEAAAAAKPTLKGVHGGRAATLRSRWLGRITDQGKVYRRYKARAEVVELLQKLVNADVRAGEREIPGVEVYEERSAA